MVLHKLSLCRQRILVLYSIFIHWIILLILPLTVLKWLPEKFSLKEVLHLHKISGFADGTAWQDGTIAAIYNMKGTEGNL